MGLNVVILKVPAIKANIVSFSGGKDSTAMLLMMIEKNIRIDEVIYADVVGAEFEEMYLHIEKIKSYIPKKIKFTTIRGKMTFEEGIKKYQWSDFKNRWCTTVLKTQPIRKYLREKYGKNNYIEYIGIAYDEPKRIKNKKYPLVEWEVTEKEALEYCYKKGFTWSGLYEEFDRLSCFLCPLQRIGELRTLYNIYPKYWKQMEKLDKFSDRRFRNDYSLDELKKKFDNENRKLKLF